MRKILFLILVVILFSGCATVKGINRAYNRIDYEDGINKKEAKVLAKKCLLESSEYGKYRFFSLDIIDNGETYPFPNHWFLAFDNRFGAIENSKYMVVIDKRTGEIMYSEKKYPTYVRGVWWMLKIDPKSSNSWHDV